MSLTSSNNSLVYRQQTDTGFGVAFSAVAGGNMSMTVLAPGQTVDTTVKNRRAIETQLGIFPGTSRFVSQIHSATVLPAAAEGWAQQATIGDGDAIVSPDGSDPLAILVADCLPVAFTTDYGPTAIAHAGRVGLLDGILENTVQHLRSYGDGHITAIIGPGICGRCYEVPRTMQQAAAHHHELIASETSWGTPALDLPAAATAILAAQGVTVHNLGHCTYTDDRLFSHRRDPGQGRLAGFVWKLPKSA